MARPINYKATPKICIPTNLYGVIEDVPEYELGRVLKMIMVYCMDENQIQYRYQQMFEMYLANPQTKMLFSFFKADIDDQIRKYENIRKRNAENGCKGGRPKGSKTVNRNVQEPPTSYLYTNYETIAHNTFQDIIDARCQRPYYPDNVDEK